MKPSMVRTALAAGALVVALAAAAPASADVWFFARQWVVRLSPTGGWMKKVERPFGLAYAPRDRIDSLEVNPADGTVWIVDTGNNRLVAISPNGTPLRQLTINEPWGLEIDALGGAVWAGELVQSRSAWDIVKLDAVTGEELARVHGVKSIRTIALGADGALWIADFSEGSFVRLAGTDEQLDGYDASGASGLHHRRIKHYEPHIIGINPRTDVDGLGSVWLGTRNSENIGGIGNTLKYRADGTFIADYSPPEQWEMGDIAINPRDGSVWVADSNQGKIWHLAANGVLLGTSGDLDYPNNPHQLVLDMTDERAWYVDPDGTNEWRDAIVKLDANGAPLFRLEKAGQIFDMAAYVPAVPKYKIDIQPWDQTNVVRPLSSETMHVAILSSSSPPFNALRVDYRTARFGPNGAQALYGAAGDMNGDGLADNVLKFRIPDTGIRCGDQDATLRARTYEGTSVAGTDRVKTAGC